VALPDGRVVFVPADAPGPAVVDPGSDAAAYSVAPPVDAALAALLSPYVNKF
jgi:hypothetical protein